MPVCLLSQPSCHASLNIRGIFKSTKWRHFENVKFEALSARRGIGEITCNSVFSPQYHLTWEDVCFIPKYSPTVVSLNLKASKTDPFRSGVTFTIGNCNSDLCQCQRCSSTTRSHHHTTLRAPFSGLKMGSICLAPLSPWKFALSSQWQASIAAHMLDTLSALVQPQGQQRLTSHNGSSNCYEQYIQTPIAALA